MTAAPARFFEKLAARRSYKPLQSNITPGKLAWNAAEIADYLKTGFTPDYDSVGGTMVEVQANMAELPNEDRAAIAAYLKAVPTVKP
jgi:mono/diheme cytochrome c family protein